MSQKITGLWKCLVHMNTCKHVLHWSDCDISFKPYYLILVTIFLTFVSFWTSEFTDFAVEGRESTAELNIMEICNVTLLHILAKTNNSSFLLLLENYVFQCSFPFKFTLLQTATSAYTRNCPGVLTRKYRNIFSLFFNCSYFFS